ncbi:transcriptional regulator NrdR [Candidatus Pacearchaeota archaeon]|nr:transcriptional regulator NrdR [Candidatus Pacearchaeota archaeon]|tara:strand:- start:15488 stop:15931 length:444 start_codon:yes stop_codon:yes gene_type:complete
MICPYCNNPETKVIDKRDNESVTRRRRECLKCGKRFTTYERIELGLWVVKKEGYKEKFSIEKIEKGVSLCMNKRSFTPEETEDIVSKIEARVYRAAKDKDIPTSKIGEIVMAELKKVDKVAYMRFAAVYKEMDSLEDFEKEIKELKG